MLITGHDFSGLNGEYKAFVKVCDREIFLLRAAFWVNFMRPFHRLYEANMLEETK